MNDEELDETPENLGADAPIAQSEPAADGAMEEANARYLRLAADFENFKRRKAQELLDRTRYASEEAAIALLPILDNLQRSLVHLPAIDDPAVGNFVDGLAIVTREFESALARLGVTPIESLGMPFDPSLHEAIGAEDSESVEIDTVVAELQPGYRLHDRVLRPAVVRIAHPVQAPTA